MILTACHSLRCCFSMYQPYRVFGGGQALYSAFSESDLEDQVRSPVMIVQQKTDNAKPTLQRSPAAATQATREHQMSLPLCPVNFFDSQCDESEKASVTLPVKMATPKIDQSQIRANRLPGRQRSLLRRSSSMSEFDRIIRRRDDSSTSESEEDMDNTMLQAMDLDGVRGLPYVKSLSGLKGKESPGRLRQRMTSDQRRAFKAKHKKSKITRVRWRCTYVLRMLGFALHKK